MKIFHREWYKVQIPNDWSFTENTVLSIYDEKNGVGALQISEYELPEGYNFSMFNELCDFIELVTGITTNKEAVSKDVCKIKNGLIAEKIIIEDRVMIFSIINKERHVLLLTYNCAEEDFSSSEYSIVLSIIREIKIV